MKKLNREEIKSLETYLGCPFEWMSDKASDFLMLSGIYPVDCQVKITAMIGGDADDVVLMLFSIFQPLRWWDRAVHFLE